MPSSHFSNNQKLDWDMDTLDLVPPVKPWRFLIVLCASERGQWLRHQKSEGMSRGWSQAKLNVLLVAFHIFKSMNNILLLYIYRMIVCVYLMQWFNAVESGKYHFFRLCQLTCLWEWQSWWTSLCGFPLSTSEFEICETLPVTRTTGQWTVSRSLG